MRHHLNVLGWHNISIMKYLFCYIHTCSAHTVKYFPCTTFPLVCLKWHFVPVVAYTRIKLPLPHLQSTISLLLLMRTQSFVIPSSSNSRLQNNTFPFENKLFRLELHSNMDSWNTAYVGTLTFDYCKLRGACVENKVHACHWGGGIPWSHGSLYVLVATCSTCISAYTMLEYYYQLVLWHLKLCS